MLHVQIKIAACMLLLSNTAQAGGYQNGRIMPVRDPATLSYNFEPAEPLPHGQLEQVQLSHSGGWFMIDSHYCMGKIEKLDDNMLSILPRLQDFDWCRLNMCTASWNEVANASPCMFKTVQLIAQ
jgi:hypothetical protein